MIDSMKNAFCLKDKVAIITGGDTGIGFGIATAMAEQGANIAIFCRRQDRAEDALQKLAPLGGTYKWYKTDITDYDNCKASVDAVVADFGTVDILVNNGGVAAMGNILEYGEDLKEWFHCIDVDLNGAFRLCYLVGKIMREKGKGKVINVTSNSGEMCNIPSFTPSGLGVGPLPYQRQRHRPRLHPFQPLLRGPQGSGGDAHPQHPLRPLRRAHRDRRPGGLPGLRGQRHHDRRRPHHRRRLFPGAVKYSERYTRRASAGCTFPLYNTIFCIIIPKE